MLRFADLPIGAQFRFASEVTIAGLEPGPWRKISARQYEKSGSRAMRCTVGSLRVEVIAAAPQHEEGFGEH
jgi:hypothetical protein